MKKILLITDTWGIGGIETMTISIARYLVESGNEVELFASSKWDGTLDEELANSCVIPYFASSSHIESLFKRHLNGLKYFYSILKTKKYDAVHINTMNSTGFLYCYLAKHFKVKKRIIHSHNTTFGSDRSLLKYLINKCCSIFSSTPTIRLACSQEAGKYLFGDYPFKVLHNSIDTRRFIYQASLRSMVRKEFGIDPTALLVGSVGRLVDQKNPIKTLEIFQRIRSRNENAVLIMVGDGNLAKDVHDWAEAHLPRDSFRFAGSRKDSEAFYSSFDVLLFPSRFEGLGISAIEAQCSGLPVLMSDCVPVESHVTELAHAMPISCSSDDWAEKAIELANINVDRVKYCNIVENSGYGIANLNKELSSIYSTN